MKTAKEWAESVVRAYGAELELGDDLGYVPMDFGSAGSAIEARDTARAIIERLVERVQADARAPLEAEIARLREELRVASAAAYGASSLASDRSYELESLRRENDMLRRFSRGAPR